MSARADIEMLFRSALRLLPAFLISYNLEILAQNTK